MRILVTGFAPWGTVERNASWDAAAPLDGTEVGGARLDALCLPVTWRGGAELVCEAVARLRPAAVVMCGLAPCASIRVERRFANLRRGHDADGIAGEDAPVVLGGPEALGSGLPVEEIVAAIRGAGIPSVPSESAGTYVCNATAYAVRHRLAATPAGFLHVPAAPEMVARRQLQVARQAGTGRGEPRDEPSMALETVRNAIRAAVGVVARAAGDGRL